MSTETLESAAAFGYSSPNALEKGKPPRNKGEGPIRRRGTLGEAGISKTQVSNSFPIALLYMCI